MKKITLNGSLRTAVFTALMVTFVGVSACSSEKKDTNAESSEAMAVDRGDKNGAEADNMAAEAEHRSTTGDSDMPESTDSATTDKSENDTTENPNADKTAADGLQ